MKYQGIALLVLLCVAAARSTEEEKSGKTTNKRGTAGVGDLSSYNNYGHSFSGRPPNPSYTDFTTPTPYGSPLHLPVKVTIARPYPVSVARPYPLNIARPYPVNVPHIVPKPYPAYPSSPIHPTYPNFGAALASIHEQWNQNKGYGAPANAHSIGFGASALQGYGLGGSGHDLPFGPPHSAFAAPPLNAYGPNPNGFGSANGKLSLLAAGLAAHPEISLAAAAAQHKHAGNPGAYSGLPGGPTKAGVLAARLAAYPEIGIATAAANKHHGPHSSVTGHADYAVAAALASQHAHTGSDFLAQLAGMPPNYATAAAAAHLGYGAHPSAHLGYGADPSAHLGYGADPSAHLAEYSAALHKFAAHKAAHGAYPDFHAFGNDAHRYARESKN